MSTTDWPGDASVHKGTVMTENYFTHGFKIEKPRFYLNTLASFTCILYLMTLTTD